MKAWASPRTVRRDGLTLLAEGVLPQARRYPFNRVGVQLAQQTTGAATTFLPSRSRGRSGRVVALWEALLIDLATLAGPATRWNSIAARPFNLRHCGR